MKPQVKLSTTKRIKCKCGAFIRENLFAKHKCQSFSEKDIAAFVEKVTC